MTQTKMTAWLRRAVVPVLIAGLILLAEGPLWSSVVKPGTAKVLNPHVLVNDKIFRAPIKSGFIPGPCKPLIGSPGLVDCWLESFPDIAHAIAWEAQARQGSQILSWPEWEDWRKADLRATYMAAVDWYAGGMTTWTGTLVDDPPANQEAPWVQQTSKTVLDEQTQAWPLFVAHVAFGLAADINGWVPWSLRNYDPEALSDLFSGYLRMFRRDTNNGDFYDSVAPGYVVVNVSTPTHPTISFKFLKEQGLIGTSPRQTIDNVLEWSRANLNHYFGPGTIDNFYQYWQYEGAPPVSRVLAGTTTTDPLGSGAGQLHWTAGCAGTADFMVWLMRVVDVPVRRISTPGTCGHVTPYFSGEKLYLSHGDDPYTSLSKAPFKAGLLLIGSATFQSWFDDGNVMCPNPNVGRRPIELSVWYPGDEMVGRYCTDVVNSADHANGQVYDVYKNLYSVAQLEATDLWSRLALKVASSSAPQCAPLQSGQ